MNNSISNNVMLTQAYVPPDLDLLDTEDPFATVR